MKPLREHEQDILTELQALRREYPENWWRPMDVGGTDASHHSRTLAKLCKLGLAEKQQRGRGSYQYRATLGEVE